MLRQPSSSGSTPTTTRYRYERILKASPTTTTILVKDPHSHQLMVLKRGGVSVQQEAQLLCRFTGHPHIVQLLDTFFDDLGRHCMLLEYCQGGDLSRWIDSTRPLVRLQHCRRIMLQLATALRDIHAAGILHRDLKPTNILLDNDDPLVPLVVKVGDFGVSKETDDVAGRFAETALGTPLYMSPEQVRGLPYSTAADMWSLGCVMFEVCCGEAPFSRRSLRELLHAICKGDPVWPVDLCVDGVVKECVEACLKKDPRDRPTAASMVLRLHDTANNSDNNSSSKSRPQLSRQDAISMIKAKFGHTLSSNILSSLIHSAPPSRYEEIMTMGEAGMNFERPKQQSALIQRIVKLRRNLHGVFGEDDDKMDLAVQLVRNRVGEQEFRDKMGVVLFDRITSDDTHLHTLRELSFLES